MIPLWFLGCPCVHPSLWAQLSAVQSSDSIDAATASKTQFLQKMQTTVSLLSLLEWGMVVPGSEPGEFEKQLQEGPDSILGGEEGPDHSRVSLTHVQSGCPSSGLSAAEVEAEVGRLWKTCLLLRQRMEAELAAGQWALIQVSGWGGKDCRMAWTRPVLPHSFVDITDCMQEYRCLLTLEGLQAIVEQCLHRLQELRAGETYPHPHLC